jgi:hypothetical protein
LTNAIDIQVGKVGFTGGAVNQPVGAVPELVSKFQEPPVGVTGALADDLKINHSKYVPPKVVV